MAKINQALKPEKLLSACTLAEFRAWKTGFELYYSSNGMHYFPVAEQQGYLRSCLELKLQQLLQTKATSATPVLGETDSCMSHLREIFLQNIPLLTRRYNFFCCDQKAGERFSDWNLRLMLEGQEAELGTLTEDDLYALRLVTGTCDTKLREEFLKQDRTSPLSCRTGSMTSAFHWSFVLTVGHNSGLHSMNSAHLTMSSMRFHPLIIASQMATPSLR